MGLARGIERRLERMVDGLASRLFRGRMHPVELGTRLEREADLAAYDTRTGPGVPNHYRVVLGGEREAADAVEVAAQELQEIMEEIAAERGWRLEGPVRVEIEFGDGPASNVSVSTEIVPGPLQPWAHLHAPTTAIPVRHNRSLIGRSGAVDVHLTADDTSRQHALLWREAGAVWLADLGSSNGTFVNGEPCVEAIDVVDGDRLVFGSAEYILRLA